MSWIKFFSISIVTLIIEIVVINSLPSRWYHEASYIIFFSFYQLLLIPSAIFILQKKMETISISCILLLLVNLLIPNYLISDDFKTLPKNYVKKLIVRGDVMPNFEGINTISTDSKGFRTRKKVDYGADAAFRVFAIGASTTEEIYIDDQETWTSLLEKGLANFFGDAAEVINTGVSGLRAKHHLATMKETEKYYPDAYIFLMGVNDWNKHIRDHFHKVNKTFMNRIPSVVLRETLIWKGLSFAEELGKNIIFLEVSELNNVTEEFGDIYSRQNNSLEKNDVKTFRPKSIDPDYASTVYKIAQRCNENEYLCFF